MNVTKHLGLCFAFILCLACTPQERVEGRGSDTHKWWADQPRPEWNAYKRVNPETSWFEIYEVRPGTFALYEPNHFEEAISFLIVGKERALLFDTGLGIGDIHATVRALTGKPIIVVNSHGHYDHIGGNHQFENILGMANAYAQSRAKGLPHSDVAEFVSEVWFKPGTMPSEFNPETYEIKTYKFSSFLMDGQQIDLGGRVLDVLHIPGHSPDSIALLDKTNQQLFVGDTFYLAPLYAHLEGSNLAEYRKTAERLAALSPEISDVMTAHNVPIVSPKYLVAMKEAFAAIENGQTPYELVDGVREYSFEGFSILTPHTD